LKILVVDDNRDAAEILAAILRHEGHAVWLAFSGRDAVALADEHKPALVLLDINMPEMTGFDVVRELRDHRRAPRPVILAVSGYGQESDKLAAKRVGFDGYLTKPVEPKELIARIAALEK
jgi:DNA-binding response OmpR family regulator